MYIHKKSQRLAVKYLPVVHALWAIHHRTRKQRGSRRPARLWASQCTRNRQSRTEVTQTMQCSSSSCGKTTCRRFLTHNSACMTMVRRITEHTQTLIQALQLTRQCPKRKQSQKAKAKHKAKRKEERAQATRKRKRKRGRGRGRGRGRESRK
jgi:hypothetical protein